jgi:heme/copper-type cytochrome/quinol oxidase subunit 2
LRDEVVSLTFRQLVFPSLLILGASAAVTWQLNRRVDVVPRSLWRPPTTILMTGRASRWWIRYAGPDGQFGTADDLAARDDLHVPAGFDMHLVLRSDDYVYVFSVPALGLKEVAVPGLDQSLTFRADRPETLALEVEPMCGLRADHDEHLVVQNVAEFEAWLESVRRLLPRVKG